MRKRYRVLLLAAIVAAFVVPVGFALSLESSAATPRMTYGSPATTAQAVVIAPVTVPLRQAPVESAPIPDGAKLFAAGTVLFGLAAIFRRAL